MGYQNHFTYQNSLLCTFPFPIISPSPPLPPRPVLLWAPHPSHSPPVYKPATPPRHSDSYSSSPYFPLPPKAIDPSPAPAVSAHHQPRFSVPHHQPQVSVSRHLLRGSILVRVRLAFLVFDAVMIVCSCCGWCLRVRCALVFWIGSGADCGGGRIEKRRWR